MTSGAGSRVHGHVEAGFEELRTTFAELLANPREAGGAFAVELGGRPVVDLWGGIADRAGGRPWERDTAAVVFSGTKGMAAMCLLVLWDRGLLADDRTVSSYWPEFGAGKETATVRHAISHLAGVPGLRTPYSFAELLDTEGFAAKVAAEPAFWPPGTRLAYHAKTFGAIVSQLVHRTDGRTIGRFFAEEIAGPLGLDAWLGLPEELEPRVATLERDYPYDPELGIPTLPAETPPEDVDALRAMAYDPPPPPDGGSNWNAPEAHRAEVASSGGIATARAMARMYSLLTSGGELAGTRILSSRAVQRARTLFFIGRMPGSPADTTIGPGFQVGEGLAPPDAPTVRGVGHGGLGGSIHGAWPDLGVSFSFVMNRLLGVEDGRAVALLNTLHGLLPRHSPRTQSQRT